MLKKSRAKMAQKGKKAAVKDVLERSRALIDCIDSEA